MTVKTEFILYTRGLLVNKSRKILEFKQLIKNKIVEITRA